MQKIKNFASDERLLRALLIPFSCLVYMSSSSWVILANQQLIKRAGFPYPICLSALGTLASAVTARMSVGLGFVPIRNEALAFLKGNDWVYNVVPVALCQAGTLALGNATYLYLGVGMVQMLKAGTPLFVLLTLIMLRLETPSMIRTMFVSLITLGTFITAGGTAQWSGAGLTLSLGAMITEALRVGLTQFLLSNCKFSVTEGQYVLAPTVTVALLAMSLLLEGGDVLSLQALEKVAEYPHLFLFAAGLGTVVNYSSYLVIKACGALTLKVVTTLRNIALVMYGALVLGEQITQSQGAGYTLALVGFVGYSYYNSTPGKVTEFRPIGKDSDESPKRSADEQGEQPDGHKGTELLESKVVSKMPG